MSAAGVAEALDLRIRRKLFPAVGDAPPKLVIENLALKVPAKGFVALFGPSGCGKTTLLNLVAGLDPDFEGEVRLPGPARVSYVFQEPRLLPWLTVEDNLKLVLSDQRESDARIAAWLAEMGLADVRAVFPNRLSLGMARRVALARAFIIQPTLLLMDEPFVSLDEPTANRLRRLLLETLRAHPATVLFVTHNLREAITLADRIALLAPTPTRVLREFEVPLALERRFDPAAIEDTRAALADDLPGLALAG
ncbi:MAG TPA: ABC transporter ATP-binding protein [Geminicoccaceae bacterium]|nr:ABC transporter ATP-binding protein [Geminicoccaceae bacterium]